MELDISIVILSHNHWDHTSRLLESLAAGSDCARETIVIDNGSDEATRQALSETLHSALANRLNLRVHFIPTNIGIASGRNLGGRLAEGSILLFLDNDVEMIHDDTLSCLHTAMLADDQPGVLSGILLNADETRSVQFAGGDVNGAGRVLFYTDESTAAANEDASSTMYCMGACFMTPKDLWMQLGGFDSIYDPMDYEDIDYCLRASRLGHQSKITHQARLLHHQHITTGTKGFVRIRQYLISGRKFVARWQHQLATGALSELARVN